MRTFILGLIIFSFFASCNNEKNGKDNLQTTMPALVDSTLVTDSSWGPVARTTDIEGLRNLYGNSNIKDERICGAECVDSVDVTFVFPNSPREFVIYWDDSLYHQKIAFIRCYDTASPYHTSSSIRIGTTLQRLVQINKQPISFSGFGWDYGGGIISLNNGTLENSKVHFNLDLTQYNDVDNAVYGDTELNTDMPVVKKLIDKIRVSELFLSMTQ